MGFSGHIFDSVNRMKSNRELLMTKRRRRAQMRLQYIESMDLQKSRLNTAEVPPETVERVKQDIREKMRIEGQRSLVLSLIVSIVLVLGVVAAILLMLF